MPPHTEDAIFFPANATGNAVLLEQAAPEPATSSMEQLLRSSTNHHPNTNLGGRAILPPQHSIPFLKRQHVSPSSPDGSLDRVLELKGPACTAGLVMALQTLQTRTVQLLAETAEEEPATMTSLPLVSPVRAACRRSLQTRMPLVLQQCEILVDRACAAGTAHEGADPDRSEEDDAMVATLRSSFALVSAVQFLDTIQEALGGGPARTVLDDRLREVLRLAGNEHAAATLRLSHWVAPTLSFDAACGSAVRTTLEGTWPLTLEVEPVVAFPADDLRAGERKLAIRACRVEVLECRHRPSQFAEGAGGLGVAFVRIRVSPVDDGAAAKSPPRIWGEQEVEKLVVKEVRA